MMTKYAILIASTLLIIIMAVSASAEIEPIDPDVRDKLLSQAKELYIRQDITGLLQLLKEEHLFVKTDVALMLGRLGAAEALPVLRDYDRQYSLFACAPSGEFGVTIILIENKSLHAQKKALLAVATESDVQAIHAHSIIDVAGRELSRFEGDDIIAGLADIYTYGAQYTVLALQCRKLTINDAISKCIAVLEAHETPLKAEAAQDLLAGYGIHAKSAVLALKVRTEKQIQPTDETFTIPKTILTRCNRILDRIEKEKEK